MRLEGKVAVVTGASRGIGRAIAAALAREGALVAGCSLRGAATFLDELPAPLRQGSWLAACDVRDPEAVARFCADVERRAGVPDLLVNNAGTVVREAFVSLAASDWNQVIETNLHGTFLVTRAFLPGMLARGRGGRIVMMSSIAGRQGTPLLTAYCTAKHGVVGLTRALAEELRGSGIQVNAICPGSVDTDMLRIGMPGGTAKMTAEEVARVALFLATEAPPALTGACLDVFG